MPRPAYLMYKCKMCDETFANGHAPDGRRALDVAEGRSAMPSNWFGLAPEAMTLHHDCAGGGIGLADLIGARPDEGASEGDDDGDEE
jgi:hypothetical protein